MKKIISILLFACAGALAACDFLDVVPEGQATQEDIFKTSKEARKYLNTLYTYAPNIAAYRYMPDFCAGDDIITATNGQTRYFPYKSMLYNEENASQTYYGLWDATTSSPSGRTNYDMYKGIRYCYIMIDNIDAVPGISPSVADEFKGEAYFLIAYYHWVLLTHYAPNIAAYRYMPDFCAGDDIITATNGQTRYFPYKSMLYNEENASQTYYGLWDATTSSPSGRTNYDMYKGIRYCYIMIDNIDAVPGISPSVADEFKGEAYFLIAYYHWVLLTHYGPVILVRGQLDMGLPEEQVYVARSPFDECVTFIAETYDRAADLLHGYPTRPDADLGRATSVAAKAMKARLLLYAASPLCNGNTEFYARFRNNDGTPLMSQTYNPEKWKWALDACQEAITLAEDNGHRLYESPNATAAATAAERGEINYHDCFVEPLWNTTEYLWAMGDQTGIEHLQRYGGARLKLPYSTDGFCINIVPTFECVEMYYTHNGLPWDRDPETMHIDPYAYNAEKETANLHVYKEPRFYASVGYDRGKYAINGEEFILKCRAGEMQGSVLDASKEYQSCTGYILKKWIHRQSAFNYDTKSWTYRKYAYPYIRLAELYLSYAEADFEYNGSLSDASLNYLNLVRRRSGLPDFKDSWALAGGIPTGDELRKVLHRERSIELLMEGMRYHDLRRWKEAGEAMSRRPKAWNLDGRTAADFYRVSTMKESGVRTFESPKTYWMAIPLSEININYNLVQNPGY